MASAHQIVWTLYGGELKALQWDVTESISHTKTVMVSDHPVETGTDVTDNIRNNVDKVELSIFVSNSPIPDETDKRFRLEQSPLDVATYQAPLPSILNIAGFGVGAVARLISGGPKVTASLSYKPVAEFDAVQTTYDTLDILKENGQIVSLYTPQRVYANMIIESWDMKRDSSSGADGRFSISLRAIRFANTQKVEAPNPTILRAVPKTSKGDKPVEKPKKRVSALAKINQATGGALTAPLPGQVGGS